MDSEAFSIARLWVVFFRRRASFWWFDRFLDPGFRHVSAAAWFDHAGRWVFYDPAARATAIMVMEPGAEADAMFGQWALESSAVLRVRSRDSDRPMQPPFFGCVAAIKALLGVHCWAMSPRQLHDRLRADGAESVPVPCVVTEPGDEPSSPHGELLQA